MKTILFLLAIGMSSTAVNAQQFFKKQQLFQAPQSITLQIVRNDSSCSQATSGIFEIEEQTIKKVAELHPDVSDQMAASNYLNLITIKEALDAYSKIGYQITATSASNLQGVCNRTLSYQLVLVDMYAVNK